MKRLILFILFIIGLKSNMNAQSFSVQHDTATGIISSTTITDIHNQITTTLPSVLVHWSITGHNLPSDWVNGDLGLCDNKACYNSSAFISMSVQTDTVKSNKPIDFKLQINATTGTNGTYYVTANMRDDANTTNKNITFEISKWPTGVTTVVKSDDDITLYPNPSKDFVNVVFRPNSGIKLVSVYNLIGKAVSVFKVNGSSAKLDVNNIPAGVYFLRFQDAQGRIIATRKFTHQ